MNSELLQAFISTFSKSTYYENDGFESQTRDLIGILGRIIASGEIKRMKKRIKKLQYLQLVMNTDLENARLKLRNAEKETYINMMELARIFDLYILTLK